MQPNNQYRGLSHVLTEYVEKTGMKQIDLAEYLNVSERTLRRWKNGEVTLSDVRELKRIAALLDVPPESLGLSSHTLPFTLDQIDPTINHIWKLVKAAKYYDAKNVLDRLIVDVTGGIHTEDSVLIRKLASIQHLAGYVKSQLTRSQEIALPFSHYHEMERLSRLINDQTLLNIALTYEGDMLQRAGRIEESILYLEEARDHTPQADISARGNALQLLARPYLKANRLEDFERALKEAEAIAYTTENINESTDVHSQYNLGTVYEEYGRSLGLLGQMNKAIDYLEKADRALTGVWSDRKRDVLIKTAKSMAFVYGGEIQEGVKIAVETIEPCKTYGMVRVLERVYSIQKYLDNLSKQIGAASSTLREALDGPTE